MAKVADGGGEGKGGRGEGEGSGAIAKTKVTAADAKPERGPEQSLSSLRCKQMATRDGEGAGVGPKDPFDDGCGEIGEGCDEGFEESKGPK